MSQSRRCAACKYLRRRCPNDCIFAPHFPPTDLERFICVHKIFGASNVAKMLQQVDEERRGEAAESIVWEARSRNQDPVHGSVGIITQLRQHIMEAEYELTKTQALIALFNAQHYHSLLPREISPQSHHSDLDFDRLWQPQCFQDDLDI